METSLESPDDASIGAVIIDPNELRGLARAYAAADAGPPSEWTPAHVMQRLIGMFEVVRRTSGRVGPRTHANGWPAMLREFHELTDKQTREQMEADKAEEAKTRGERPTAWQIEQADEAMQWAWQHLADAPHLADALQLWAFAKAHGDLDVRKILRRRAVLADAAVAVRQAQQDARAQAVRRAIAGDCIQWANSRLEAAHGAGVARLDAIRHNARIRCHRELRRRAPEAYPPKVRRQDVIAGKVFTRTMLDRSRKAAAALIVAALRAKGVAVR